MSTIAALTSSTTYSLSAQTGLAGQLIRQILVSNDHNTILEILARLDENELIEYATLNELASLESTLKTIGRSLYRDSTHTDHSSTVSFLSSAWDRHNIVKPDNPQDTLTLTHELIISLLLEDSKDFQLPFNMAQLLWESTLSQHEDKLQQLSPLLATIYSDAAICIILDFFHHFSSPSAEKQIDSMKAQAIHLYTTAAQIDTPYQSQFKQYAQAVTYLQFGLIAEKSSPKPFHYCRTTPSPINLFSLLENFLPTHISRFIISPNNSLLEKKIPIPINQLIRAKLETLQSDSPEKPEPTPLALDSPPPTYSFQSSEHFLYDL